MVISENGEFQTVNGSRRELCKKSPFREPRKRGRDPRTMCDDKTLEINGDRSPKGTEKEHNLTDKRPRVQKSKIRKKGAKLLYTGGPQRTLMCSLLKKSFRTHRLLQIVNQLTHTLRSIL